jgi:alginate O-acetyltransferase complex protein AlgI
MAFSSNFFLFAFLPAALLIYCATPPSYRNATLLVIGLLFYSFDSGWLAWILVFSIVLNHFVAQFLVETEGRTRRVLLAGAIALNLALLFHYKYTSFLWSAAASVLGAFNVALSPTPQIELPIGISFFTFQAVSYLADVYQRRIKPAPRLVDFGMYHSLFPQLIAGPIVRYAEIERAIFSRHISWTQTADGIFRFSIGFGKKIILADTMGSVADPIFALPGNELTLGIAWLGVVAYTLQIYFDFSGYSDMAIGLGKMFGFDFPENFNLPYRSRSITEFWRRWHMTLSRWFRDYVYIPLGGNRRGPWRTYRNLFVVFFLCGLWHGAGFTFIVWGIYHGALLAAEHAYRDRIGLLPQGPLAWPFTLLLVMIGWVFFRSSDLQHAAHFLQTLFGFGNASFVYYGLDFFLRPQKAVFLIIALFFALAPLERFSFALTGNWLAVGAKMTASFAVLLYAVLLLSANSFNPFIYFRF